MIRISNLSDEELTLAFLNNFVGYSQWERKRLMAEHVKRTLSMLGVHEKYKVKADKTIRQFSCDDHKRIIRYNPAFIESGPSHPGVYAYLLICHECMHARQNESFRNRDISEKNPFLLNQTDKIAPQNDWSISPACGYVSMACALKMRNDEKDLREAMANIYRLQPTEFEAYSFQFQSAERLQEYVRKNSDKLINVNFVKLKINLEISSFHNFIEDSQDAFETKNPEADVSNALIQMFEGQCPQNYVQALFQIGAMMTYELVFDNKEKVNLLLELCKNISEDSWKEKTNEKYSLKKEEPLPSIKKKREKTIQHKDLKNIEDIEK